MSNIYWPESQQEFDHWVKVIRENGCLFCCYSECVHCPFHIPNSRVFGFDEGLCYGDVQIWEAALRSRPEVARFIINPETELSDSKEKLEKMTRMWRQAWNERNEWEAKYYSLVAEIAEFNDAVEKVQHPEREY